MRALILLVAIFAQSAGRIPIRLTMDLAAFHLACESSELSATTDGATVTPRRNLSGITGTLHVAGTGAVSFVPLAIGTGASFLQGRQQGTNTAYYRWEGAGVSNVFAAELGEVRFFLKSSYSWAQRQALAPLQISYVYDVWDGDFELWAFRVDLFSGSPNRLKFQFVQDGTPIEYDVPAATEDAMFGLGVTLAVRVTWDGRNHATDQGIARLYLNETLVQTSFYSYYAPNWTAGSTFTVGAQGGNSFPGFFSLDDAVDDFQVRIG